MTMPSANLLGTALAERDSLWVKELLRLFGIQWDQALLDDLSRNWTPEPSYVCHAIETVVRRSAVEKAKSGRD